MKNYNYEKIDELLQPLMTMMQEEFPNGFKLIVEPHFAQIIHENTEMMFKSEEMKNTSPGEMASRFAQEIFRHATPTADTTETAE